MIGTVFCLTFLFLNSQLTVGVCIPVCAVVIVTTVLLDLGLLGWTHSRGHRSNVSYPI